MPHSRRPRRAPRIARTTHHQVADFSTLPELIEHAKTVDGATHILVLGRLVKIYFPTSDGRYEEGVVWQQNGYWHAPAQSARTVVSRLPAGAEPIGSGSRRAGRTSEANLRERERTIEIIPEHGGWVIIQTSGSGMLARRDTLSLTGGPHWSAYPNPMWGKGKFNSETEARAWLEANRAAIDVTNQITKESPRVTGAKREPAGPSITGAMQLADEISQKVGGTQPKTLPGGFRWSEKNEAAQFTTHSPEHGQKVVVVVSTFADGSFAVDYFGDEWLSETARYENVGHFTYASADDLPEMVKDIRWVWETVDRYAASWQEDEEGNPLEETRRPGARRSGATADWTETPAGHAKYLERRAEAQRRANATGMDHGLERNDIFKDFTISMLPAKQNRYGYELRVEVVHPEDLSKTQPGHGPMARETGRHPVVRDYIAVDPRGRPVAGPFTDYNEAKREADRARGYVKFASPHKTREAQGHRRFPRRPR